MIFQLGAILYFILVILAYDLPIIVHDLPRSVFEFLVFLRFPDTVTFLSRGVTKNSATLSTGESLIISNCLLASAPTKLMLYILGKRWIDLGPLLNKSNNNRFNVCILLQQ